jgi:hypothetical protein
VAIIKTEIVKNPNGYYQLKAYSDLPCNEAIPTSVPVKKVEDGTYYYAENSDGIVNFGFLSDNPNKRPGDGKLWSSNSMAIRKNLGRNTMEIIVVPKEGWLMGASMLIENVKKYLIDGYHIKRDVFGFDIIMED